MTSYFDTKSAGRLRKRRRQKGKLKAAITLILISALVAAGAYGYHQGLKRKIFNIKQVNIKGHRMADSAGIREIAGSLNGRIFWQAGYNMVAARISGKYPAVKRTGFRVWPWGVVDIEIIEREPLAEMQNDRQLMIDAEGVIFKTSVLPADGGKGRLPRLKGAGSSQIGIWRSLRLIETAPWVENDWLIDPSDENDIRLWLPGDVAVHFGNGSFKKEWQKLGEVLESLKKEGLTASEIDLRFKGQAVIKGQALVQGRDGTEGND